MLNKLEQLKTLINNSQYPLIIFGAKNNNDSIASALALKNYLTEKNKIVDIVSDNFIIPKQISFLKFIKEIKPDLPNLNKFTIKINVSQAKIDTLSYDINDNWLSIHLSPKQGIIKKTDLRTLRTGFKYDLIFTIDTPDLKSIGNTFYNNTDLFYRIPLVNIDHKIENEHYGTLNLIDPTATSTSEIIFKLFHKQISETGTDTATSLLTGMISKTRSFKTQNITPKTLNIAGQLMNIGADREKIIKNLYHTKSISMLKLWGQALINLENDNSTGLVWTTLTRNDFIQSETSYESLNELNEELISNSHESKLILIIFEDEANINKIHGHLTVDKDFDALAILKSFNPKGNKKFASFNIQNNSLEKAKELIVLEIKKSI